MHMSDGVDVVWPWHDYNKSGGRINLSPGFFMSPVKGSVLLLEEAVV